jgi:putative endonuclease
MASRQEAGRQAEQRAEALLRGRGLKLLTRNYRCRGGEIDLVMRDAESLVFVEVRYRRHAQFGGALSSVDANKRRRLVVAAQHYLVSSGWQGPCRFDVVGFDHGRQGEWIRDAFGV